MTSYSSDEKPRARSTLDDDIDQPPHAGMSIGQYIGSRISTLKPPMRKAPNPFKTLALLNFQQWMFFLVAFAGWTWDAFDFFTVSLTVEELAEEFSTPEKTYKNSDITWGITLVLMLRSIGSIIFGRPSLSPLIISLAHRWGHS